MPLIVFPKDLGDWAKDKMDTYKDYIAAGGMGASTATIGNFFTNFFPNILTIVLVACGVALVSFILIRVIRNRRHK